MFGGYDVFLSYSTKDRQYVDRLASRLVNERQLTCYVDRWALKPGALLPRPLLRAIKKTALFVLVSSEDSLVSRNVLREVDQAISASVPILIVSLDDGLSRAFTDASPVRKFELEDLMDQAFVGHTIAELKDFAVASESAAPDAQGSVVSDAIVREISDAAGFLTKARALSLSLLTMLVLSGLTATFAVAAAFSGMKARASAQLLVSDAGARAREQEARAKAMGQVAELYGQSAEDSKTAAAASEKIAELQAKLSDRAKKDQVDAVAKAREAESKRIRADAAALTARNLAARAAAEGQARLALSELESLSPNALINLRRATEAARILEELGRFDRTTSNALRQWRALVPSVTMQVAFGTPNLRVAANERSTILAVATGSQIFRVDTQRQSVEPLESIEKLPKLLRISMDGSQVAAVIEDEQVGEPTAHGTSIVLCGAFRDRFRVPSSVEDLELPNAQNRLIYTADGALCARDLVSRASVTLHRFFESILALAIRWDGREAACVTAHGDLFVLDATTGDELAPPRNLRNGFNIVDTGIFAKVQYDRSGKILGGCYTCWDSISSWRTMLFSEQKHNGQLFERTVAVDASDFSFVNSLSAYVIGFSPTPAGQLPTMFDQYGRARQFGPGGNVKLRPNNWSSAPLVSLYQPGTHQLALYDGVLGTELARLPNAGSSSGVVALPDHRTIASWDNDGVLRIQRLCPSAEDTRFRVSGRIGGLAFSPDGKTFAAENSDGSIYLGEASSNGVNPRKIRAATAGTVAYSTMAIGSRSLATTSASGDLQVLDYFGRARAVRGFAAGIRTLAAAGDYLAAECLDGKIRIYRDWESGAPVPIGEISVRRIESLDLTAEGLLVVADRDSPLRCYRLTSSGPIQVWTASVDPRYVAVTFMPHSHRVLAGDGNGSVNLLSNGRIEKTFKFRSGIVAIAVSEDGRYLAASCVDHYTFVENFDTGAEVDGYQIDAEERLRFGAGPSAGLLVGGQRDGGFQWVKWRPTDWIREAADVLKSYEREPLSFSPRT